METFHKWLKFQRFHPKVRISAQCWPSSEAQYYPDIEYRTRHSLKLQGTFMYTTRLLILVTKEMREML